MKILKIWSLLVIFACSIFIQAASGHPVENIPSIQNDEVAIGSNLEEEIDTTDEIEQEEQEVSGEPEIPVVDEPEMPPHEEEEIEDEEIPHQPVIATDDTEGDGAIMVVANPEDIVVLVNKQYRLPDGFEPEDLVYPDVRFIFSEKVDKRKMRQEAATGLEEMFAMAEVQGIYLAGASGYRSYETQEGLYNHYVNKDGKEKADQYSARPGHSEHQTGLTMDISGSTGECAVQDCFADTPEAEWLADNAHLFGFILRYPKGKEHITGYKYEPWHFRYVGIDLAKELYENDLTLEEYYHAVPVEAEEESES